MSLLGSNLGSRPALFVASHSGAALRRSENPAQNFVTNPARLVARFNCVALRGSTGRSVEAMASFPSGKPNFVFAFLRLQSRSSDSDHLNSYFFVRSPEI